MMRAARAILPALLVLAAGAGSFPQDPAPPEKKTGIAPLFIKGGTVHTISGGDIDGGCVLIRDGKIAEVGRNLVPPAGAVVLDAAGRWIMPGFVVAQSAPVGMAPSVKDDADPDPADYLDPFSLELRICLAAGVTTLGPSFDYELYASPGGGRTPYSFRNAVIKPAYGRLERMVVKSPGYLFIDMAGLTPSAKNDLRALLTKARDIVQRGALSEAGPDLKNYVSVIRKELPVRFKASREKDILKVLSFLDEFPVQAQVLGAEEGWLLGKEMARRDVAAILQPQTIVERDPDRGRAGGSVFRGPVYLSQAGVRFALIGRTSGVSMSGILGSDLLTFPLAGAFAVRGGLGEDDALRSLTALPAALLGVADRVGTIEPGKDADIIICDGNPLDYRSYVEYTILDGEIVYDKTASSLFKLIPQPKRLF